MLYNVIVHVLRKSLEWPYGVNFVYCWPDEVTTGRILPRFLMPVPLIPLIPYY